MQFPDDVTDPNSESNNYTVSNYLHKKCKNCCITSALIELSHKDLEKYRAFHYGL